MADFRPDNKLVEFVLACRSCGVQSPAELWWDEIRSDGSDRSFFRVSFRSGTALLVVGQDRAENRSYELIGRHLWTLNEAGPRFLCADQKQGLFLVEDLGDVLLQNVVRNSGSKNYGEIYKRVISLMVYIHRNGTPGFDPDWCYQTPCYDKALILNRETGYFTAEFLKGHLGTTPALSKLDPQFEALAEAALKGTEKVLMHRDFQSRNILIKQGKPRLIDFQGARLGPPGYDLASLLYDPYVPLSDLFREEMLAFYIDLRSEDSFFDRSAFTAAYYYLAVCRLLQALGAYGFLSRVKGKSFYLEYIPPAVRSLKGLLDRDEMSFLPELRRTVGRVSEKIEDRA